jgi:glutamate racemase
MPTQRFNLASCADRPIGLFDSGLGGLTVLSELKRRLPAEKFIYLGDTARTPYGSKGHDTIVRYSRECARFLLDRKIKALVVACNTSSAHALSELESHCPCPVIGTIEPAVRYALHASKGRRIGVIGTEATIASEVYQRRIAELAPEARIAAAPCPLFVPLVEQGMVDGEIVDKVIELYLAPLRAERIDTLILGCTHYPLLLARIAAFMGKEVAIVECSRAIADEMYRLLEDGGAFAPKGGAAKAEFFVTDALSRFNNLTRLCLGDASVQAERVELS